MMPFRKAASQALVTFAVLSGAAPALAQPAKPAASAIVTDDLQSLVDQALNFLPSAELDYKPAAHEEARKKLRYAADLIALHPPAKEVFVKFIKNGGKIHFTNDPIFENYAEFDEDKKTITIQSFKNLDIIAVLLRHELSHDEYWEALKARGISLSISDYTLGGFLRYRLFNEALAQTRATDFAHALFLKGKPGPLQTLLDMDAVILEEGGSKEVSNIFYENIAKAYLSKLYKSDARQDFDLSSLPRLTQERFVSLRPSAQGAAFEAWFGTPGYNGGPSVYMPSALSDYSDSIQFIGWDDELNAYVEKPAKKSVATNIFGAADLQALALVDGRSFYKHLPAKIAQDRYLFDAFNTHQIKHANNVRAAAAAYKAGKGLPIRILNSGTKIYTATEVEEYKGFEWRGAVEMEDYFNVKPSGRLDQAKDYVMDGAMNQLGITFTQYLTLKTRGALPAREQWTKEKAEEGLDTDLMRRVQFLYAGLRQTKDIKLFTQGQAIVKRLRERSLKDASRRHAYMEQFSKIVSSMICNLHGFQSHDIAMNYTKTQYLPLDKQTEIMVWGFYDAASQHALKKFRPVLPKP